MANKQTENALIEILVNLKVFVEVWVDFCRLNFQSLWNVTFVHLQFNKTLHRFSKRCKLFFDADDWKFLLVDAKLWKITGCTCRNLLRFVHKHKDTLKLLCGKLKNKFWFYQVNDTCCDWCKKIVSNSLLALILNSWFLKKYLLVLISCWIDCEKMVKL